MPAAGKELPRGRTCATCAKDQLTNRSQASSNQISASRTRIFKIRDQRLADKIRPRPPNFEKRARQRLDIIPLTGGNLVHISAARTFAIETGVAGWGGRTRTSEWRNQNPLPYHLATPHQAAFFGARTIATAIGPIN